MKKREKEGLRFGWMAGWPDDEHRFTCEHRLYTKRYFGRFSLLLVELLSFHLLRLLPCIKKICYVDAIFLYPVNDLKITIY